MKTAWVVSWLLAAVVLVVTLVAMGIIGLGMPVAGAGDIIVEMWFSSGAGGKHPNAMGTEWEWCLKIISNQCYIYNALLPFHTGDPAIVTKIPFATSQNIKYCGGEPECINLQAVVYE